ncbi:MAG TPA: DegV family protein [Roseiflexaceae bacterium]|nr:DegV family protein [Roseiflexaceae bacterium]
MIKIVVDSTADIPAALREQYDITTVPVLAQFGTQTFRDDVDITRDEFYTRLVASPEPPKTAAPSVGMFEEVFRRVTADGSEVLSISVAGALSGTYNAARQAAQLVEGARIACADSRTATMAFGFLAIRAAEAIRSGASLDAAVALVEQLRTRTVLYVALDTLRYLEKGGRIGRMRALLGTMLSVKPILEVRDAEIVPVEQVRTSRRVPPRLVELGQSRGAFSNLAVLYTTTRDIAEQMADLCAAAGLMPREQIGVVQASGVLGVHTGPGALGLAGILKG